MSDQLYRPAGSSARDPFDLEITAGSAGWAFSTIRTMTLQPGGSVRFPTGDEEMILLPLQGAATVAIGDQQFRLNGRSGVFDAVTDFAYLPIASVVDVRSSDGGRFALPGSIADRALPFRYGAAENVSVELRGAGTCSRQVNNFATPNAFETVKMIACEVITPAANWSSYPPHKHDTTSESESELEEIYYFQFRAAGAAESAHGVGYQRVYGTSERPIDVLEEVSDGDVVLVPHGWHGPSIAAPSHDMYYLNTMAGPEPTRAWKICDDPVHAWVRQTWTAQDVDPRLPCTDPPCERWSRTHRPSFARLVCKNVLSKS
jgi:5-deoxy-glucuronate isomerase